MENIITKCPIWQTPAKVTNLRIDALQVDSLYAGGTYIISGTVSVTVGNYTVYQKKMLTAWLIRQRMMGDRIPVIYSNTGLYISHSYQQYTDVPMNRINSLFSGISDAFESKPCPAHNPINDYSSLKRYLRILAQSTSTIQVPYSAVQSFFVSLRGVHR